MANRLAEAEAKALRILEADVEELERFEVVPQVTWQRTDAKLSFAAALDLIGEDDHANLARRLDQMKVI